ncbi:SDR family oxidoreductase [Mesorhizobium sp.]|uniref:SDR family NAD(P)-dependent oxidoreductase n=1 Tax=Mesorhizobium sp. TaxID=1871066 RepID=UPI0025D2248D|nr:SDR family oxidoreductase [Mesorhizobium sp.]
MRFPCPLGGRCPAGQRGAVPPALEYPAPNSPRIQFRPQNLHHAMMKGGIEVFTRYLAKELGQRGITANTVAPGAIATDFNGGHVRDNAEINRMVAGVTALGRAGVADDIGPMIASLLSEDNRWVNAQRIEVSGGMNI